MVSAVPTVIEGSGGTSSNRSGGGSAGLSTSDPAAVRNWLASHHPKQLALLDKFEIELRLGRLATTSDGNVLAVGTGAASTSDRLLVTLKTVQLMKTMIGSTRWRNAAQLLALLRGLGRELHEVGGKCCTMGKKKKREKVT